MDITWAGIKEVFFFLGSCAGLFTLMRPLFESKAKFDEERFRIVKADVNERWLHFLADAGKTEELDSQELEKLDQLAMAFRSGREVSRFSGPFANHYRTALGDFVGAWEAYRKIVCRGPWLPAGKTWRFDRNYFTRKERNSDGLIRQWDTGSDEAIANARAAAGEVIDAYKKLTVVSELHLLEWPIAGLLLRRRFKAMGLEP
ncbi:hypothetical protein NS383_18975 [Pseudomonas oryzihabitans]|nr:hypothetical protein NS383_18975 [Pseudomonas psychrotolerans]